MKWLLSWILVLGLGAFLRVWRIDDPISGFYVDEAAIAYNARSLWETGGDEYGQFLPLAFRSFGDFKAPLFEYFTAPWVGIWGEVLGARLAMALSGAATILVVGILAQTLTKNRWAGLMAALSLAINPWHVYLSRHVIEPVFGGLLLSLALLLAVRKQYGWGLVILAFSALVYHSTKYTAPILAIPLAFWWWREGGRGFWWVILVWVGVLAILLQPFSNARAGGVIGSRWLASYVSYFNPRILSIGDWQQPRNFVWGVANIWGWSLILFYWGLIKRLQIWWKEKDFGWGLMLLAMFLAPVPASLTKDPFGGIRALIMLIPMSVLVGVGAIAVWQKLKAWRWITVAGFVLLVAYQTLLLGERLGVQDPIESYDAWQAGYGQLVTEVMKLDTGGFERIVADTTDMEAIYSLWQVYGKVPTSEKLPVLPTGNGYYQPGEWQAPQRLKLGSGQVVEFRKVYWPKDQLLPKTLFVGSHWRFDPDALRKAGAKVLVEIKDPRGEAKWLAVVTP